MFNFKKAVLRISGFILLGLSMNSIASSLYPYLSDKGLNLLATMCESLFPLVGYLIIVIGFMYTMSDFFEPFINRVRGMASEGFALQLSKDINEAKERVKEEPNKVKPAWDLARLKLEMYFDRNLMQINYIFWLSVAVMVVGFLFILYGLSRVLPLGQEETSSATASIVGTIAGIITEFIGATFLFIYKSTMQQATAYTKTLERINSVGMAMQILDTISQESQELQDKTKSILVKQLVGLAEDDAEK